MVTTAELNRRGLRYAVVVDGAATPASLQALDRQGLPYLVEVADGATMASRRALEARGLRYLVPVLVDASAASKASLAAQGLRYAVQVDADILPADRLVLQRQGLTYYVEVDSSGNSVSAAAVGGGALLTGETDGFATDFLYATDAQRVALKTGGTVVESGLSFFTNSGTSSKWVFNAAGTLVNVAAGSLALDYDPVTHAAKGLLCEPQGTNNQTRSSDFTTSWLPNDATVSANIVTAPNGLTEADALIPIAGVGRPFVNWTSTTTAATVTTYSLFAKNGTLGTNWIEVQIGGAPTVSAWFNLATGVVGTATGSPISRTITAVGNGWYRLTVTFTAGAGSAATYLCADDADGGTSGTGDGTKSAFYLWGTQMEAGTVATSYIPTLAATVTRAGDMVKVTSASINYSSTAGSWWVDLDVKTRLASDRIIAHHNGAFITPLYIGSDTTFNLADGIAAFSKNVSSVFGLHKVANAFASGDRAITADGLAVATDTTAGAAPVPGTNVGIGNDAVSGTQMTGYIRKVRYLPRRKTNLELVAETA
jgi:hypothetical protein